MAEKFAQIIKKEIVLSVSIILAVISMIIVPVNKDYISYIDFRTLSLLFCMMVIMAGFQKLNLFQQIGETLVAKVTNIRQISFVLIILCFVLSMFITNDVALLTFVPFTVVTLHISKKDEYLIPVIVLETVAANLGSMLMPMGNPQNLYLYSLSNMDMKTFVMLMLPYSVVSLIIIAFLNMFFVKSSRVDETVKHDFSRNSKDKIRLFAYAVLFIITLLVVVHVLDYRLVLAVVLCVVICMDWRILISVDYSLIFTFVFLFIFIGNLKCIDMVSEKLEMIVKNHEILTSVVSSQIISNVPSAILLSGFTDNIRDLIIGTNIGGLGTLIASMASLISFKIYGVTNDAKKGKYILVFTGANVGMLILLYVCTWIF